ncbi:MAG: hypothetical protein ACXVOI_10250 [Tumebacillaceae bacterium]
MWFFVVLVAACVLVLYLTSGPKWRGPSRKDPAGMSAVEIEKIRDQEQIRQDSNRPHM